LEPVRVKYIPATTRATMARLGLPATVEVAGDAYELPPHDMPGELQWRVDLLKWLVRKIFHYLGSLPKDQWIQKLLVVERELMTKTGLHIIEAQAVAESALGSIHDLSASEIEGLKRAAVYLDARSKVEGDPNAGARKQLGARRSRQRRWRPGRTRRTKFESLMKRRSESRRAISTTTPDLRQQCGTLSPGESRRRLPTKKSCHHGRYIHGTEGTIDGALGSDSPGQLPGTTQFISGHRDELLVPLVALLANVASLH
jgi:hypothetical protein